TGGTLSRYIGELSVTGLTSNPTIFDQAIKNSHDYDAAIREKTAAGLAGEDLFFELALEDLTRASDLFRPIHEATNGVDGWGSLAPSARWHRSSSADGTARSRTRCPPSSAAASASRWRSGRTRRTATSSRATAGSDC